MLLQVVLIQELKQVKRGVADEEAVLLPFGHVVFKTVLRARVDVDPRLVLHEHKAKSGAVDHQ